MPYSIQEIIDIHVHPTLKPFNNSGKTIWEFIGKSDACRSDEFPKIAKSLQDDVPLESQSNLYACAMGKMKAVFFSLYPPELRFFDLRNFTDLIITGKEKEVKLGACLTGFGELFIEHNLNRINNPKTLNVDYFAALQNEYTYLKNQQGPSDIHTLKIAEDYNDLKSIMSQTNHIAGVLTIEGMHSLGSFNDYRDIKTSFKKINNRTSDKFIRHRNNYKVNIDTLKQWGPGGNHAPFFVTFCHHFWNLLCGHARSFEGMMRVLGINQSQSINKGFSELGKDVLDMLLDKSNGRRILIDIKHMSAQSRVEFYKTHKKYVTNGDPFPIICSHSAVNQVPTLKLLMKGGDNVDEIKNDYMNSWSINLCTEDIIRIVQSDGMIGLMLHKKRMPGGLARMLLDSITDPNLQKKEFVRLFLSNVFHIIRSGQAYKPDGEKQKAWDHICLGSDLDGLASAFKYYDNAVELPAFASDIYDFLENPPDDPLAEKINMRPTTLETLKFGLSNEEIVNKIFYKNILQFMEKYYHDGYLRGPVV